MKNIHLKGNLLFKICGIFIITLVLGSCCFQLDIVSQPSTAKVGDEITIKVHYSIGAQLANDIPSKTVNGIFGFLAPKGWKVAENATITYTSTKGDGKLVPLPANTPDPGNPGYTYSEAMMLQAGRGANLINDMEWVVFKTDQLITYTNGNAINGDVTIKLKAGADGNDTKVQLGYMFASTGEGISKSTIFIDASCPAQGYFVTTFADCMTLTDGTTGDMINFCDPQYSFIDPPKALDNDFVSVNFDANAGDVPSALANKPGQEKVYFCGDAILEDGTTVNVCRGEKATLNKYADNKYRLTLWPRNFFGITDAQNIVSLRYFITDETGAVIVGKDRSTTEPFVIKLKCL